MHCVQKPNNVLVKVDERFSVFVSLNASAAVSCFSQPASIKVSCPAGQPSHCRQGITWGAPLHRLLGAWVCRADGPHPEAGRAHPRLKQGWNGSLAAFSIPGHHTHPIPTVHSTQLTGESVWLVIPLALGNCSEHPCLGHWRRSGVPHTVPCIWTRCCACCWCRKRGIVSHCLHILFLFIFSPRHCGCWPCDLGNDPGYMGRMYMVTTEKSSAQARPVHSIWNKFKASDPLNIFY